MEELENILDEIELQSDDALIKGNMLEHKRLEERWFKLALLNVDLTDLDRLKKINFGLRKRIEFLEGKHLAKVHRL